MKTICMMVGNIGAGKSTLVNSIRKQTKAIVLSRDAVRYHIGGGEYVFNLKYEKIIHETVYRMYFEFLELGEDIIIDETNTSELTRRHYLTFAKFYGYKTIAIKMPFFTKKESVDRRMENSHGKQTRLVWGFVWDRFNAVYRKPSLEEGFDKIIEIDKNVMEVIL